MLSSYFFQEKIQETRDSIVSQMVESLPARWETWVRSLGWEDSLEKEMATHSIILAWKILWMKEPSRLQSIGSQRVGHNWATSLSLFFILFCRCLIIQWMFVGYYRSGPLWWDMWVVVFLIHSNRQYHTSLVSSFHLCKNLSVGHIPRSELSGSKVISICNLGGIFMQQWL